MRVPQKWWWVVAIAVPILAAIITIVPLLFPQDTGGGDTFYVAGTQFNGDVAFNSVTVVIGQVRQISGEEMPDTVLEALRKALKFVESREFDKAIPLLESVAEAAPVPALFNNLGAAYLATGSREKARSYFEKALTGSPGKETTARFNLNQILGPTQPSEFSGVEAEVTRFEDTGGMITLEVTFRNVSANPVGFSVEPAEAYLLDERTGKKWDSVESSKRVSPRAGGTPLNPGHSHRIWMKFLVGDAVPEQFTAVVPSVARPFEQLVLN